MSEEQPPNRRDSDGRMRRAKNLVKDRQGHVFKVTDIATAEVYLEKFFAAKSNGKVRAKKYVTLNGFSHPEYPTQLPAQGLVKTALAAIKVLADKAVEHDEEALQHLKVLRSFLRDLGKMESSATK